MDIDCGVQAHSPNLPTKFPELKLKASPSVGKLYSDVYSAKARPSLDLLKSHSSTRFSVPKLQEDDAIKAKKLPPLPGLRNLSLTPPQKRGETKELSPRKARAKMMADRLSLPKMTLPALTIELEKAQRVIDRIIERKLKLVGEDKNAGKTQPKKDDKAGKVSASMPVSDQADYASYWNGIMISEISVVASQSEDPEGLEELL